ncbi:MAG: 3'-5' exonuclease [Planctomycetota bacterium]
MILKLTRPIVFFDLETTGLDITSDRVIEIGLVRLAPDGTRETLLHRVDPGIDIPEGSTKIHGIHNDEVRGLFGKPRLPKVAAEICTFIGEGDLGGFNCKGFDLPLWLAECKRHSIAFDAGGRKVVDAKLVFNAKETGWDRFLMGPRNLSAAVRHYCGRDLPGAHSAEADTLATIDVLLAQLERYPDLPRDVPGLHAFCEQVALQQKQHAENAR